MSNDPQVVFNNRTKNYHLASLDDDGNVLFDYGSLKDRIDQNHISDLVIPSNTNRLLTEGSALDAQLGEILFGQDINTQPGIWVDSTDQRQFIFDYAAGFDNVNGFLQIAASADFNFNTSQKFSIVFWRQPDWNVTAITSGTAQIYLGHGTFGSSAAWLIASGGSAGQGNCLQLLMATNVSGSALATSTFPANQQGSNWPASPPFSMGVVTYDGTQGTAANRPVLYQDGVAAVSPVIGGTFPANPNVGTAMLLSIGRGLGTVVQPLIGKMNRILIFAGRVLSQSEVTTLWNSGKGYYSKDLIASSFDLTGLVLTLDCVEPAGSKRYDLSGNSHHASETSGTVAQAALTQQLIDKGRHQLKYYPRARPLTSSGLGQQKNNFAFCSGLEWEQNIFGNLPAIRVRGQKSLYANAVQPFNYTAADIFIVNRFTALPAPNSGDYEAYLFSSAGEYDNNRYWIHGLVSKSVALSVPYNNVPWLRIRNNGDTSLNNLIVGKQSYVTGQNYVTCWRVYGTGTPAASSFECRVNGVNIGIENDNSTVLNSAPASVYQRNNCSIAGLDRSAGTSDDSVETFDCYLGQVIIVPLLSTAKQRSIENTLMKTFGVI